VDIVMAANPIATPMTADEFLRMTGENDAERFELIEGEICERDANGYAHDLLKNNLKELFDREMRDRLFKCWLEHSFRLGDSSVVTPDAAIILSDRLVNRTGNSPTDGAPEIPFEVAISDRPTVLQRKVSAYLRNGAHAVCCVYPELRSIVVYTAHEWRELSAEDMLEFPALLPGIAIPIAAVFQGV
jgi:Uma2 family endonuclease